MAKFLCKLGLHRLTGSALSYRVPFLSDYETYEEYVEAFSDGVKKMVTGRECENCGKVRWGK